MASPKIDEPGNDPLLQDVVNRLVASYHPLRIYLFGSRALGSHRPDSDYDILLVVSDDAAAELKNPTLAYKCLVGVRAPVDVIVWTEGNFSKRLHLANSLPAKVVREGLLLHVA